MCPGRGRPPVETTNGGGAWSDYFYNNYINDPMQADRPDAPDNRRTLMTIQDGTSNTVFVGHGSIATNLYTASGNVPFCSNIFNGGTTGTMRAGNPAQTSPAGVTLRRDSPNAPAGIGQWGGPFPHGGLFVMGDGSVRTIPYTANVFNQMLTPAGGEAFVMP